ncbi:MAG: hypothetical protein BRD55_00440 [Bacteroidetes bacterium SW_9_63_38]|nr:MAG: hypothetical protein BRD55_00440 [Bacteroidetes bacterium SW_9_63_38]
MVADDDIGDDEDSDTGCLKQGCGLGIGVLLLAVGYGLVSNFPTVPYCIGLMICGAVVGMAGYAYFQPSSHASQRSKEAGMAALGVGGAALLTSLLLMLPFGGTGGLDQIKVETIPSMGGTVGPFTVEEKTWVDVAVEQEINSARGSTYKRWSFVTVELLDDDKKYLSSFGGGFWNYAGYDEGYRWSEDDERYQTTLTLHPGTYYVRFKTEADVNESELGPIRFRLEPTQWWGDPAPLQWLAYISCFLGAALFVAGTVRGLHVGSAEDNE